MTKTTLQIVPNGPIETFNDAPMRVNGVRIQPTWAWSNAYRKHVRSEMAKVRPDNHSQADAYRRWYKATHGVEYKEAK